MFPLLKPHLVLKIFQEIPLTKASLFSVLTYKWVSSIMVHNKILQIFLHVELINNRSQVTKERFRHRIYGNQMKLIPLKSSQQNLMNPGRVESPKPMLGMVFQKMDSLGPHLPCVYPGLSKHFYLGMITPASLPLQKRGGARLTAGRSLALLLLSTIHQGPSFGPQAFSRFVGHLLVLGILRCHFPQVFGDISQLMCPLVIKVSSLILLQTETMLTCMDSKGIINFAKARQAAKANHEPEPSLGIGVAMAIGLFLLTVITTIGQNQVSSIS